MTALSAPSGLAAARTYSATANSDSVALSWTAATGGVTGCEPHCSTAGGTSWSGCGGAIGASATSHTVTGLDKDNAYVVRLRAVHGSDNSAWVHSSSSPALAALCTPTGLSANTSTWTANWTAPSNTGAGTGGISRYEVQCRRALATSSAGETTTTSKCVGGNRHCKNWSNHGNHFRVRAFNVVWGSWSRWHRIH